jgi:hypothetical protein
VDEFDYPFFEKRHGRDLHISNKEDSLVHQGLFNRTLGTCEFHLTAIVIQKGFTSIFDMVVP